MKSLPQDRDNQIIIAGIVRADGSIVSGLDFSVSKGGTGYYTVHVTKPIKSIRSAVSVSTSGSGIATQADATVGNNNVAIYTMNGSAAVVDSWFSFFIYAILR